MKEGGINTTMKKKLIVMLALLLAIQGVFGTGLIQVLAAPSPGDNIITKVTLEDLAGNVIDAVYEPDRVDTSKLGDKVRIKYDWTLENGHGYTDGDTVVFDIPKEFTIYNRVPGILEVDDPRGDVGTFVIETDGRVTITFNDNVAKYSEVSGTLEISTVFSETEITGNVEVLIPFPIQGGTQVVKVNFTPKDGKLLTKSGVADKAKKIDWTIDMNTSLQKIDGAVLSDTFPIGLTLDPGSIKVYNLQVNLDRAPSLGSGVSVTDHVYTVSTEPDGSGFAIHFVEPTISSAYRVQYSTFITDDESLNSFTNDAVLTGTNIPSENVSNTVHIVREELLTKEGAVSSSDRTDQLVAWKVKYNYAEKSISQAEAVVHDRFNVNMNIVPGSFKVTDQNGVVLTENVDYLLNHISGVDGKSGYDISFLTPINSKYDIEYKTQTDDRIYQTTTVTNDVYTTFNGNRIDRQARSYFYTNIGVKRDKLTDYSTKTNTWEIVVNSDKKPMTDLIIADAFSGSGLVLIENSFVVSSSSGTVVPYTVDQSDLTKGFTMNFTGTFIDTYTITYKTHFIPESLGYRNTAKIEWDEKQSEYTGTVNLTKEFTPNNETRNNGRKDGRYDAGKKEITWDIVANYNGYAVNDAVFTDQLQDHQMLDESSVRVYEASVNATGNVIKGNVIHVDPSDISYVNGLLTIDLGNITEPVLITFVTKLDKTVVLDKVNNEAMLIGNSNDSWSWDKTLNIPRGEVYVDKSGIKNGSKMDWTIKINEGQSYVKDAKLIDYPSSNQILDVNSFVLYQAIASNSGNQNQLVLTKGDVQTIDVDYTLAFTTDPHTDEEKFVLTFMDPIDTAYILEYSSQIAVTTDDENLTNRVEFEGNGISKGTLENNFSIQIKSTAGSGTGSGVLGNLEITKVDQEDHSNKLEGAKFKLQNSSGVLIGEKVTDSNGVITFTKLLYGTYTLIETEAPQGYELDPDGISIVIDSSVKQTGGIKKITVENARPTVVIPTGQLEITKVDKDDTTKTLEGATFVLQDVDNLRAPITMTTGSDGKAVFTGLLYGDYLLTETVAPSGYTLDSTIQTVTIDSSIVLTNGVKSIAVENAKPVIVAPTGQLEITKVDKADTTKVLEGAVFVLQDADNLRAPITITTGADGKAVFSGLQYGNYLLTETVAPIGYTTGNATQAIIIDNTIVLTNGVLDITITNNKTENPGTPPGTTTGTPPGPTETPTAPETPKIPKKEVTTPPVNPDEEYTAPDEPIPSDGTNGNKPQPTEKPSTNNPSEIELDDDGNPLGGSDGDKAGVNGAVLPKTGENSPWLIQLFGVSLIVAGAMMLRRKYVSNRK